MIVKSLKWRLQLWYGLILLLILTGFGITAYHLERGRVMQRLDSELHRRAAAIAEAARPPLGMRPRREGDEDQGPPPEGSPNGERIPEDRAFIMPPMVAALFDEKDPNGYYYALFWRPQQRLIVSANAPNSVSQIVSVENRDERLGPGFEDRTGNPPGRARRRGGLLEVILTTPRGDAILVGHNMRGELAELNRVRVSLGLVGGTVLLIGLIGGWWLASRAIRPIQEISATAAGISTGDLSQRVTTNDTESELGQLAATLNSTFARLEAAFSQQAQFTSDAAHELRTPVSVVLTQTQSALAKERTVAEYRETLEACQRAAQRMRRLTESLLQLARLDAGQEQFQREPFDMAEITRSAVELLKPIADQKLLKFRLELASAQCSGDSDRMAQVVTNLITNAIKHSNQGGEIRITTGREQGAAVMTVTDLGSGIAAQDMPRIFERFYRGDKARTASEGSAGLGLAICKAIVVAHGGSMEATSEQGKGAIFSVRLPASV